MIGLGWMEILMLLCCTSIFFGGPIVFAIVYYFARRGESEHPQRPTAAASPSPPVRFAAGGQDEADLRQTIIARLTQRFCPGCRTALAADAPEGLCPACLMAGGLASEAGHDPIAAGMAATTPPSGSRPPATGEWADLAPHFPELEVLELLGRGGMGAVYKARQKNLDRMVALKVIPPDAAKDPAFTERFNREARALARMNHPNIVTVYDFGEREGVYYLLMEYVDGVNLRHTLRAGNLEPREALAIVPQICDALQYAHDQGVVHRDIKPENVLLDRTGRVKIADFGLAKLLGTGPNDFTLTRTQQIMGTPRYMAPEQIEKPTTVDHRADIYSLGVVLYEMLTGELPIGRFDAPSHKVEIDVRIDHVVMRALEKSPDKRYQRASEVKSELVSATSWQAGPTRPPVMGAAATPALTSRPVWNTPAPATKSESSTSAFSKSASWDASMLPPGEVLGVAIGMVTGILLMIAGLALCIYGILNFSGSTNSLWAWVGSGFGCLVGGFGAASGSYNTYRQMTGAHDLMRSPEVTWLDWVMRGFFLFGLLLLTLGLMLFVVQPPNMGWRTAYFCLLLGGISSLQAGLFLTWRALTRPPGEFMSIPRLNDIPRPQVLLVAMGIVAGVLLIGAGLAMFVGGWIYTFRSSFEYSYKGQVNPSAVWGIFGAAFGCAVGGVALARASYSLYRQMAGAEDLLRSPRMTWLDWVMSAYLAVGLLVLAPGIVGSITDPNEEHVLPMTVIGGILTLQAGLFLSWRTFARPAAQSSTPTTGNPVGGATHPVYLQAGILPVAILVGIWILVLVDVVYARPPRGGDSQTRQLQMAAFQLWHEGVVIGGVLTLVVAIVAYLVWRIWGPRETDSTGRAWVPSPFAGRGWSAVVAALAALALLTPWFRLEIVPESVAVISFPNSLNINGTAFDRQLTVRPDGLQEIAAMPSGWRMAHRGIESEVTACASLLLLAGAILTIVAASVGRPARGLLLLGFGGAALLLIQLQMRQTVEQRQDIAIDRVTTEGLLDFARREQGNSLLNPRPLIEAVGHCYRAVPSVGLLLATVATSLSLIFGASQLCWGTPQADGVPREKAAPRVLFDPAREAIRRRVAGPAIGLILVGILGLLPMVLLLLAIPAFTLHRVDRYEPPRPPVSVPTQEASWRMQLASMPLFCQAQPLPAQLAVPLLLAAESPAEHFAVGFPLYLIVAAVVAILGGIFSMVMIVAGYHMQRLRFYGLAVIASVLAMIPVSLPWIIGLPIGIWSLAVLLDPKVREAFES